MATTAIDTLRYARRLKAAGVPEHQAEEMASALGEEIVDNLSTKTDIAELRAELKTDIATLEARLTWRLLSGVAVLLTIHIALLKLL